MVFSYVLASGQHKAQCIPADSPPSTGHDPRRRKARTASRQPSPVSPRPSTRHVSPPSKRQKPCAVRPAPPAAAKASHLNASFANSKLPKEPASTATPIHPVAALPRSPPPDPVPNVMALSGKAAAFRRCRSRRRRRRRTKPFSFVPFEASDFATVPASQQQPLPPQLHASQQGLHSQQAHAHSHAHASMQGCRGPNVSSQDVLPATSATAPTVSPCTHTGSHQYPDARATPAVNGNVGAHHIPLQMQPRMAAATHTGYLQPSSAVMYNPQQWAPHPHQQLPFVQAFPAQVNGAGAPTMVHALRAGGEGSPCSHTHAHVHPQMNGVQQQQQATNHRQGVQPSQQAQLKHPLPISHAEMGRLFQSYLRNKKITREEFSKEHRESFKHMVLQLSAQRMKAQDGTGGQHPQHAQQHPHPAHPQQQQSPQQHLQYAVVLNNQNALARGAQMHLQQCHAQGSMGPSAMEQSAMMSQTAMHGGNGMHANTALGGLPAGSTHGVNSMNNVNASARLASPHAQHINAPHAVHAGGHMHLQAQGMYSMGMQGHVLGHAPEAINHMGGLAVQSHHPNARCVLHQRSL